MDRGDEKKYACFIDLGPRQRQKGTNCWDWKVTGQLQINKNVTGPRTIVLWIRKIYHLNKNNDLLPYNYCLGDDDDDEAELK